MKEAVGYVRQRRQFGAALSEFQDSVHAGDMETKLCCARALIYDAAEKKDAGMNITKRSGGSQVFCIRNVQ